MGSDGPATQTSVPQGSPAASDRHGGTGTRGASRPSSGLGSTSDSRFLPGTMLAARYRIVGLLGRGGMGEVYRADDLKLDQPVALKFLPAALERNPDRLSRFLNEVKVARQVSHPNVCRVYDIGETDGQHFLSMEYVDGEDLASLLRRMGRPEREKALELARQICAGLAAAHSRGIVHRDLKPANVMIDGEGQVRITDFGLAGLAEGITGSEIRAGTPDYMAPEQLAGREVTLRSDLYALGLLLYELFTGKQAFHAESLIELKRLRETTTPASPSSLISGFDPVIERVILRCLEQDPSERPGSAIAVAAALPGGDPLAAALAAGETPSPEMVAQSGASGGLRLGVALTCLLLVVLGLAGVLALSDSMQISGHVPFDWSPAEIALDARRLSETLGLPMQPVDTAYGVSVDGDYIRWVESNNQSAERWDDIGAVRPSPVYFWHRQSPRPLVPVNFDGFVTSDNPPTTLSSMVSMRLDLEGRLLELVSIPPQVDESEPGGEPPDWTALFDAAGLDPGEFETTEPTWVPLVSTDNRAAWDGTLAEQPDIPLHIEAGAYRGQPVYFKIVAPWSRPSRMQQRQTDAAGRAAIVILLVLLGLILLGAIVMTRRNLRLGRSDRRGAFRMALVIFLVVMFGWVLTAHHVASLAEVGMLFEALQGAALLAGIVWIVYLALEPYVRRFWPQALITWSRLLAGHPLDPLVGRDALFGVLAGVGLCLLIGVMQLAPEWLGRAANSPGANVIGIAASWRQTASIPFLVAPGSLFVPIALLFLILILRVLLKNQWAAMGTALALMSSVAVLQNLEVSLIWPLAVLFWVAMLFVLFRLGLLASIIAIFLTNVIWSLPLTLDSSKWHAVPGWMVLLAILGLAAYGFRASLAGRPLFVDPLSE